MSFNFHGFTLSNELCPITIESLAVAQMTVKDFQKIMGTTVYYLLKIVNQNLRSVYTEGDHEY